MPIKREKDRKTAIQLYKEITSYQQDTAGIADYIIKSPLEEKEG